MRTVLVVALTCLASGCALEAPPGVSGEEVGHLSQAIFGGEIGGDRGIVGLAFRPDGCVPAEGCRIDFCTGVIVADGVVMTAGHCLRNAGWGTLGNDSTFIGEVGITVFDETDHCLTRGWGNLVGSCRAVDDNDVVVGTGVIHPMAIRNAAQFDIGLLHTGTHWADFGVDRSDVARIALSSTRKGTTTTALAPGDSFLAFGFGANGDLSIGDVLRFDRDPVDVDAVTNSPATGMLLRNDADTVRMCDGDSGSPAYLHAANGLPITAGVLATGSPDASCSPVGTQQFWSMLQTSADFIESTLEQKFGRTCTPADLAISSDVSMQVLDCL